VATDHFSPAVDRKKIIQLNCIIELNFRLGMRALKNPTASTECLPAAVFSVGSVAAEQIHYSKQISNIYIRASAK